MPITPLRKTPKRKREKVRDFLTNISEKNKLLDLLYSSPEESFDETIGGSFAFGVTPKGHHDRDSRKSGDMQMVLGEGLKDLWRQSGSPRIKMHDKPHASYEPSEQSWEYGKKTPLSFMKKMFGSDKIYLPKDEFGGADKGMAISELAHGMRFADPEQFSKYGSRKELVLGKGQEHAEDELYHSPGTDEYETHREVEPVLRDWLIKNYSAGFQQGGPAERAPLLGYMNPVFNPEGSGYDMETALDAGLTRDEIGHMGSLDPRTGMVLKGKSHESWNPMVQTEMSLGNTVEYDPDKGRYFSVEGGMYNPAVQDETAHSQMDRLIFENKMSNIRPEWGTISNPDEGYDFAKEWAEGMMPIGGALRLLKGTKDYSKMLKQLSKVADREKKTYEVFEDAARKHGPKIDAGGADKAGKDYLTTKWIQRLLQ